MSDKPKIIDTSKPRTPIGKPKFIIRKSRNFDPPISREILGPPRSRFVDGPGNQPGKTVLQKQCRCCECGRVFWWHENSVLCPKCKQEIDLAMALLEEMPEGSLPRMVSRTVGSPKGTSKKSVRPRIMGERDDKE